MLWVLVLGAILIWAPSPTITHRTAVERAHIKPKPCSVNGIEGTCMFVYECIKTDGKHVGMCVDNFMFGSCCSHNMTHNAIIPNHHHNHQSNHHHHHHHHNNNHQSSSSVLYSSNNIYSSPRPPNHVSNGRPQSNKHRPSKPVGFVTHPTRRPPTSPSPSSPSQHWFKEPGPTSATPHKHYVIAKPWTSRPSFATSSESSVKLSRPDAKHPEVFGSDSSPFVVPINSSPADNRTSSTASPHHSSTYDLIATSKPTTIKSTSLMKNKTTMMSSRFTSTTTTTTTTLRTTTTTTTTTSKPTTRSTPKPSWLVFPPGNNILPSSKPSSQLSKPDYWTSEKPSFYSNSVSWAATNEPHFVTRPRPSSNLWSKPTRKPIGLLGMLSNRRNLTATDTNASSTAAGGASHTTTETTFTVTDSKATSGSSSASSTTTPSTTSTTTTTTTTSTTTTTPTTTETDSSSSTTEHSKLSNYKYSGQCGVAALSPRPEMRIVGGKNAPFGGWPWQVSVRRTSFFGFSSTHRCGGAVINENWIATAGHCVDDLLTSQIRIRVGEYDFSSIQEPYPFVERGVSKKVVHPKYNFFTYEYDLALVRLESSLEFQPHISPICLPASDDLLIGENATVTGWGRLSEGGTLPSVLQQVSVPIVSNDKCKSMFLRAGRHEFIPEIFLCAGYENGGQDSCQGDSGGPLQVKGKNGRYFLAGIISWGIGCAEANLPGVCTRISKFVPWILENVT